ncbi:hypothetical protein [Nocardioides sp. LML1-1-1.1]|uniref:hypothetical protein n=1 Tax=Nocardioides sp. LML1-1-1.1 TaxID=3135248 RepID=UPI00341BE087
MTTTAKIAAKGTNNTGFTEDLAKRCHDSLGKKVLAVVELVAESRSDSRSGDGGVTLSILTLEPAPDTMTEKHLRELARSFHYERQLANGEQPTLPLAGESTEPNLVNVLRAGAQHEPHPFISAGLAVNDNPVCDVCGKHEGAAVHADRTALKDPFAAAEPDEDEQHDEGDDEDHEAGDDEPDEDDAA